MKVLQYKCLVNGLQLENVNLKAISTHSDNMV